MNNHLPNLIGIQEIFEAPMQSEVNIPLEFHSRSLQYYEIPHIDDLSLNANKVLLESCEALLFFW